VGAAVASELLKKRRTCLFVDEPIRVEWPDVGERRVFSPPEYQA